MNNQRKMGRYISVCMGITMSVVMSLVGSLMGASEAAKNSSAPFVAIWLPSFLLSLVAAVIMAVGLGFIIPMNKINGAIAKSKAKGFALRLRQALVSDLIYTILIATVMAFLTTAVFALPNSRRALRDEITAVEEELKQLDESIIEMNAKGDELSDDDKVQLAMLAGKSVALKFQLKGMKDDLQNMRLVPMALKSLSRSILFEFVIALVVILIVEPLIQKKAFNKYIKQVA